MTHAIFARLCRLPRPPHRVGGVLLLGLALFLTACSAATSHSSDDQIALARTYRLAVGQRVEGDLLVVVERATLEAQSVVRGDLTVTARTVELDGAVGGDVVVAAERLRLGPNAQVGGDLVACVRTFERAGGARVLGDVVEECDNSPELGLGQLLTDAWLSWQASWLLRAGSVIFGALFFGALAALGTVLVPRPLACMAETIQARPWQTASTGLLTLAIAVGLTVLYGLSLKLIVTVVFLPAVLLGWLVLGFLSLLGWIALAAPIGQWLLHSLRRGTHPQMIAAAIGGMALALGLRVWNIFEPSGWLVGLVVLGAGSVGLGAVLLTRAGTKPDRCG